MNQKMISRFTFVRSLLIFGILSLSTMAESKTIQFVGGKLLRQHQFVLSDFWIKDGVIVTPQKRADEVIRLPGKLIAPGYIDLQINGAFGVDFTQRPESVGEVAQKLPQFGVTAFLPTIVSSAQESYAGRLRTLREVKTPGHTAQILGMHLEGPFFAAAKKGAHNTQFIQNQVQNISEFYGGNLTGVRIVTLAPELPGALEAIHQLSSQHGIIVSVGHTQASTEQVRRGVSQGLRLATHLRNAMPKPGQSNHEMVSEILNQEKLSIAMIVDGHHVNPAQIRDDFKKAGKRFILVTDAVSGLGLPDGTYSLADQKITIHQGTAKVFGTQTLAGSVLSMDQAVKNLVRFAGATQAEAIEAATLAPAQLLRVAHERGTLEVNSVADFIILDEQLNLRSTYIRGQRVYQSSIAD